MVHPQKLSTASRKNDTCARKKLPTYTGPGLWLRDKKDFLRTLVGACYDTCVLRLTRVRARPYARLSVSRVCTVPCVAAYAVFLVQVCKHRLASARSRAERTETTGNVYIDDRVVLSALQLSDAHVDSSPIEMDKSGDTLSGWRLWVAWTSEKAEFR